MATILVVDDQPDNRKFLVKLLGYHNHRLLEAANGSEGLHWTRKERPDLIITDILMPVMDGYEFVRQVRADAAIAHTPIIFYTANYLEPEARRLAQTCGVQHILTKPVTPQVVLDTVHAALEVIPYSPTPIPLQEFDREHLQVMTNKLAQKVDELEIVNQRLAMLVELGQQLALQRDPLRLFERFCHQARELIDAKYAAIGMLDETKESLVHFVPSGMDPQTVARLGMPSIDEALFGQFLAEGRPWRLQSLSGKPEDFGLPSAHPPVHSFLGVPIVSPTHVSGWFYFADKLGTDEFSEDDEQIAVTLAAQLTVAYENLRLYDEIQRHAARLEQEVIERRQAEEALRVKTNEVATMTQQLWQTAKLATMGELAASIAHELNNPLATASLRVESLLAQAPEDDPKRRTLEIIAQEVERMASLVANLLQFTRRSQRQISTLDVRKEIETTVELIQYHLHTHSISVVQEFASGVPMVHADRQQLRQLFLNLLTNASDAMPEGGTLMVRMHESRGTEGQGENHPRQVVIEIADTGVGIAPEDLPRVMEPFFTTKPEGKGTGLGLAICQRIVEEHHGMLDITSEVGQGTTVRIILPAANGTNAAYLR